MKKSEKAWGYDGRTHTRRGPEQALIIFRQLIFTILRSYVEGCVLPRRVEVSGVLNLISLDFTVWQRGHVPNDPQRGWGSGRCIVYFNDPWFVPPHAYRDIEPDSGSHSVSIWNRHIRVHGEATIRRVTCVEPYEHSFDGRPSLSSFIRVINNGGVGTICPATVTGEFYCITWVVAKLEEGTEKNSLAYDTFEESIVDGIVSFGSRSPKFGRVSNAGRSIPYVPNKSRRKS